MLFFSDERTVDLNAAYGTRGKRHKVRGLIDILSSYKFTIAENTPIEEEVALDPELLGKVFENLLAAYNPETEATARKQTGSYYTPREIVNYMTDESLVAYLKNEIVAHSEAQNIFSVTTPPSQLDFTKQADPVQTELGVETVSLSDEQKAEIEQKLRELFAYNDEPNPFDEAEAKVLIEAIDTFKILDPAVGSGAFPMGVLHRLVFILGKLDSRNEQWKQRQIDRVENTIEIAGEIDDSTIRESTIRDLEGEIESINEAFERNELDYGRKLYLIENCIYGVDIQPIATQIAKLRFFISLIVDQQIDDSRENHGVRPLPNLETKFVAANTLIGVDKPLQTQIRSQQIGRKEKELEDVRRRHFTARTPRTKAKYRTLDAQIRAEISELLESVGFPHETTEKIAHWDPYDQNASADFFDPEWMFSIRDGFDVVIGNPPYVRQEAIRHIKPQLAKEYGVFFTKTADLFVYFYKRSIDLIKTDRQLCFISSNKFFRARYGLKLRQLLKTCRLRIVIDFGELPVFAAGADPAIIQFQKAQPEEGHRLMAVAIKHSSEIQHLPEVVKEKGKILDQKHLEDSGWSVESGEANALLNKLRGKGTPLGEYIKGQFYMGIKTGLNEAFVVDGDTRNRLIAEHPSSAEVLKPFLRGRDVRQWQVNPPNLWLIFAHWGIQIDDYPAIKKHLEKYSSALRKRAGSQEWYELQSSPGNTDRFEQPKIIFSDIGTVLKAFYTEKCFYGGNTVYVMPVERLEVSLLAILLSKPIDWFARQTFQCLGDPWKGGRLRFFIQSMVTIPIPPASNTDKARLSELTKSAAQAEGEHLVAIETEINQIVYDLFDLTPAEVAIVERTSE